MPFVPKTELESLQTQNARLSEEVAHYEEMAPHLELAKEIRSTIVDMLGGPGDLSAQQIGELAYEKVLREKVDQARDDVAARYEQQHRRELYDRVVGTIAVNEGEKISDEVRTKVETDPIIAKELRESARRELAARAKEVIRDKVTAEQAVVINAEAERQIDLDHLDVRLSVDHELDLSEPDVKAKFEPGDIVELFYVLHTGQRERIFLTWTRDALDHEGWIFTGAGRKLFDKTVGQEGHPANIAQNKFVTIGCVNHDMEQGIEVIEQDKLVLGLQLVLLQQDDGELKPIRLAAPKGNDGYGKPTQITPVLLTGVDFQTKSIEFALEPPVKKSKQAQHYGDM